MASANLEGQINLIRSFHLTDTEALRTSDVHEVTVLRSESGDNCTVIYPITYAIVADTCGLTSMITQQTILLLRSWAKFGAMPAISLSSRKPL